MTEQQINFLLEKFDQTEPSLKRRIVARFVYQHKCLLDALRESVKLQTHYAELLNMHDGGKRMAFTDAVAWMDRLAALGQIPADHGIKLT